MYRVSDNGNWQGRNDPNTQNELFHQIIERIDLNKVNLMEGKTVSFLGFCSDEGIKRNLGRPGAVEGPMAIRKTLCNMAIHFSTDDIRLVDAGNVSVEDTDLETGQLELANRTTQLLNLSTFPLLIGGGHEISYGHAKGVFDYINNGSKKIGMINIDPHFDLRKYPDGSHSGSWARQLFDEFEQFSYFVIGINPAVNIRSMFDLMAAKNQSFISMDELLFGESEMLIQKIRSFIDSVDFVCLTLDLDVFSAAVAPGVSALNPYGVMPEHIKSLIETVFLNPKLLSFDIAEMSPVHDDGRTAGLAASFIYDLVMSR